MPRVKAITTGSVPSFSDVILNLAESESMSDLTYQDTILAQFKARLKGRLVMYGDDTWLKLFPHMFDRADGTTSFFVSDFVEVDNNVTRHISEELMNDDWSAMVLHYLGLDHIGHKAGPKSLHMIPKQYEMDSIVKEIYTAMEHQKHLQSALLILCGDHGMNEAGNHGGSSAGETSPALTFISPRLKGKVVHSNDCPVEASDEYQYYRTVEQSDITPTLAGLLGVPIPLNNLGVFIPEMLSIWDSDSDRLKILLENSRQILEVVKATFPGHTFDQKVSSEKCRNNIQSDIEQLECAWFSILDLLQNADTVRDSYSEIESALLQFLREAQKIMSGTASNYKILRLYLGSLTSGIALLISLLAAYKPLRNSGFSGMFLMVAVIGNGSMMFASSYVEEEQQFWYWITTAWTIYLYTKSARMNHASIAAASTTAGALTLAIINRIIRRWNQTGQKFAGEPDIAQGFLPSQQKLLWTLILLAYLDICRNMIRLSPFHDFCRMVMWSSLSVIVSSLAFAFKLAFTAADSPELLEPWMLDIVERTWGALSLVIQARVVFLGTFFLVVISLYTNITTTGVVSKKKVPYNRLFHEALTLFLITQSKSTNIPLFLLFRAQTSILASMRLSCIETTVTSIFAQYMAFFAFGGSNAISSIDLSSAYNGVSSYNVFLVGLLTFLSNWAGPICMAWALLHHIVVNVLVARVLKISSITFVLRRLFFALFFEVVGMTSSETVNSSEFSWLSLALCDLRFEGNSDFSPSRRTGSPISTRLSLWVSIFLSAKEFEGSLKPIALLDVTDKQARKEKQLGRNNSVPWNTHPESEKSPFRNYMEIYSCGHIDYLTSATCRKYGVSRGCTYCGLAFGGNEG
ncbi:Transferase (Gpi7) [Rasamsonia emersonii CBS 393.64]|uniref:GPI ethanolamine phosphate transferase 2 n=1 Tax=Rasamsonia emersonii (strain ATCC 16479 / CBS 393.64 / IMI 116815) TaxID=1408163 RepID=A0A0F4YQ57_RASE3|nr:Transferase (Gpi7) [Rasamsonia emersonii CBS 393.64]KKA20220.1 Transferase (Gpi7) [Rasamsonia emersonii CBS 393.64]